METLRIVLKNKKALTILKSLERVRMIRLIPEKAENDQVLLHLKGSISKERAIELVEDVENSRSEWGTRTI
jgi:hypothetical protein